MQDGVDCTIDVERLAHIVLERLEVAVASKVGNIAGRAGNEVIDAQHLPSVGEQPLAKVRSEKARAPGDDRPASPSSLPLWRRVARASPCSLPLWRRVARQVP